MLLPTMWARLDVEGVEKTGDGAGEVWRVVGGGERLVGVAEARQIDGDHPMGISEGGDGGQERGLGAAEAVEADDGVAGTGGDGGDPTAPRS